MLQFGERLRKMSQHACQRKHTAQSLISEEQCLFFLFYSKTQHLGRTLSQMSERSLTVAGFGSDFDAHMFAHLTAGT